MFILLIKHYEQKSKINFLQKYMPRVRFELTPLSRPHLKCGALDRLGHLGYTLNTLMILYTFKVYVTYQMFLTIY